MTKETKQLLVQLEAKLNIKKVEDGATWLQGVTFEKWQNVESLNRFLHELTVSQAFVNNQMAIAKQVLNIRKEETYNVFVFSAKANGLELSPMLAKDYIASRIHQYQYDYDVSERTSRTITHTIDAVRTAISAIKEEIKAALYSGA